MKSEDIQKIVNFLYEVGTLRKIARSHRQTLFTEDTTDNISSHSYRSAFIAWFLAKAEKADPYKAMAMSMLHDLPETRSGDQNWVHKKYVKVFEDEIIKDQLKDLPFSDFFELTKEYEKRESKEAKIAKDADLLDQILILKEYEMGGNNETSNWLKYKKDDEKYYTKTAKKLSIKLIETSPSNWWKNIWTNKRR